MNEITMHGFILRDFANDKSPTDGDEIVFIDPVSNSSFHMERMNDGAIWFCITARDPATGKERHLHINLVSKSPIRMAIQDLPDTETDTPDVQKPAR